MNSAFWNGCIIGNSALSNRNHEAFSHPSGRRTRAASAQVVLGLVLRSSA